MKKDRVLIVAAHPDDEVLGCGGTIARLAREGHYVTIAILGEGLTSRKKERSHTNRHAIDRLGLQSRRAARILGARQHFSCQLPDNRFDTVPLLDIVKIVEGLVRKVKPSVIYTHHQGDLNIDHQITHRAVLTATRPIKKQLVKEIYAFSVLSATEWSFRNPKDGFQPRVFIDISKTLNAKLAALSVYKTEIRPFPHPRSVRAVEAFARYCGSTAGYMAAEPFEIVRLLR